MSTAATSPTKVRRSLLRGSSGSPGKSVQDQCGLKMARRGIRSNGGGKSSRREEASMAKGTVAVQGRVEPRLISYRLTFLGKRGDKGEGWSSPKTPCPSRKGPNSSIHGGRSQVALSLAPGFLTYSSRTQPRQIRFSAHCTPNLAGTQRGFRNCSNAMRSIWRSPLPLGMVALISSYRTKQKQRLSGPLLSESKSVVVVSLNQMVDLSHGNPPPHPYQ